MHTSYLTHNNNNNNHHNHNIIIIIIICGCCSPWWTLTCVLQCLIVQTVGRSPWAGDQLATRPLLIQDSTDTKIDKHPLPLVGFKPTTSAPEWVKTVHTLDEPTTSSPEWVKTIHTLECASNVINSYLTYKLCGYTEHIVEIILYLP
jgi:hypothetical protein